MSIKDNYPRQIQNLAEQIHAADAILIGGGSGLSSSAGYNHYHWSPAFKEALDHFYETYHYRSPMDGYYYSYSKPEEQWGYYSEYIHTMWEAPTGQPYLDLKTIISDKPFFVLTTNVDMQFNRIVPQEHIFHFQGDFGYFQCSQPCHDNIYNNHAMIKEMHHHLRGILIPSDLLPRCPKCSRIMVPWVRDDTFLQGRFWKDGAERYQNFLRKYLIEQPDKKVLLLELGVGEMSLSIIKLPFWKLTAKNSNVFYTCINKNKSSAPEHLKGRSQYIAEDIAKVLHDLCKIM